MAQCTVPTFTAHVQPMEFSSFTFRMGVRHMNHKATSHDINETDSMSHEVRNEALSKLYE